MTFGMKTKVSSPSVGLIRSAWLWACADVAKAVERAMADTAAHAARSAVADVRFLLVQLDGIVTSNVDSERSRS
jgi:hypothetical protein